jgi:hypothetical protein
MGTEVQLHALLTLYQIEKVGQIQASLKKEPMDTCPDVYRTYVNIVKKKEK